MPLPKFRSALGATGSALGGLASIFGAGLEGYAKDQTRRVEQERNRQRDLTDATLNAAQIENYKSQAAQRKATADQDTLERDTLAQWGTAAAGGDKNAQMRVAAVFGPRAPTILKEYRDLNTPRGHTDSESGMWINDETHTATPIAGLTPQAKAPVRGTKEYLAALRQELELRQRYHPYGQGASAGEVPQVAYTRRDLKDVQSQQIRAEHDVGVAKSDIKNLLTSHPQLAKAGWQPRTAGDSSYVNQLSGFNSALAAAEARKRGLTTSADSMRAVIGRLRQGQSPLASDESSRVGQPAVSKANPQRVQQEIAGFTERMNEVKSIADPKVRQSESVRLQKIFNDRVGMLNAGVDPDPPDDEEEDATGAPASVAVPDDDEVQGGSSSSPLRFRDIVSSRQPQQPPAPVPIPNAQGPAPTPVPIPTRVPTATPVPLAAAPAPARPAVLPRQGLDANPDSLRPPAVVRFEQLQKQFQAMGLSPDTAAVRAKAIMRREGLQVP